VHLLDRVGRTATGPVAVGSIVEIGLEDRFQYELGGDLSHPIPDRRDTQRTLAAPWLRDHHPPHRRGPVRLQDEFLTQARQPCVQTLRFDLCERHPVHTGRARIGAGKPVGVAEDVFAADLVVEQVEAECRLRLRLTIKLSLKGPDLIGCFETHGQSPPPLHLQKHTRSQGPSLRRSYPGSAVLCPCPTPTRSAAVSDAEAATSDRMGLPRYPLHLSGVPCPLPRRIETGALVDCFPAHAVFPVLQAGRHPHLYFRGLLRLHSRYGLVVTSVPKVPFWKACDFNKSCLKLPDNILICLEIQLLPFGETIQGRMYRQVSGQAVTGQSHT
jgi:hypothetical protein